MKVTICGVKMSWSTAVAINFGYKIVHWKDIYKVNGKLRDSIGFWKWVLLWFDYAKSGRMIIIP